MPSVKEADVIIVDASVLVNALGQVKKWCRDGQEEIIIVPLEGTLFILFIGSFPGRARSLLPRGVTEPIWRPYGDSPGQIAWGL
jgi:hypothetical protein